MRPPGWPARGRPGPSGSGMRPPARGRPGPSGMRPPARGRLVRAHDSRIHHITMRKLRS